MAGSCEPFRDAISALADGETAPVGADALATHLAGCERCTAFAAGTGDLDRQVRVAAAEPVPDLTTAILAAVDTPDVARGQHRYAQVRGLLALAGAAQLVLAVPLLLTSVGLAPHATREVGIFEVALGIGFLVAAWRPARAAGMLPIAAVVAALATITSLADVAAGSATFVAETAHLLEVAGTGLLWALDRLRGRATLHPAAA